MIVYSCWFGKRFGRMINVLRRSVLANCPGATFRSDEIAYPIEQPRVVQHASRNTAKLHQWNTFIQQTDEPVVLLDADMLVLRDLVEAFEETEFDVAYTVRPGRHRINAGALYVNSTSVAREFMADLVAVNDELMANVSALDKAVDIHGGVNQAALTMLLKQREQSELQAAELPCAIWNCTKETWSEFGEETAVIHVNTLLRRAVETGRVETSGAYGHLALLVHAYLYYARMR